MLTWVHYVPSPLVFLLISRPTFKYFTWHTTALGFLGCLTMCFLIEKVYMLVACSILCLLVLVLHYMPFERQPWGSISQALLFHQVRKYLLMLDLRKAHVKFWRPQILHIVSNPLTCCDTIDFINDIKKGGLYVVGHVEVGDFEKEPRDPTQQHYESWLSLVDLLKVKAFIELTMAPSVREGMHHLIRCSGLGGMKPNTICLGFYDSHGPINSLASRGQQPTNFLRRMYTLERSTVDVNTLAQSGSFPSVRQGDEPKSLSQAEYVNMLVDIFKMSKNICLFRNFHLLDKEMIFQRSQKSYIDVWPVNVFRPDTVNYFDTTCLFMLQLACILHMVKKWEKHSIIRIFMCIDQQGEETERRRKKLSNLLLQLRILGELKTVEWNHVTDKFDHRAVADQSDDSTTRPDRLTPEYLTAMNQLIRSHTSNTAVCFLYLPKVPKDMGTLHAKYLKHLDQLTDKLPPTVLVHGIHPVTSTSL